MHGFVLNRLGLYGRRRSAEPLFGVCINLIKNVYSFICVAQPFAIKLSVPFSPCIFFDSSDVTLQKFCLVVKIVQDRLACNIINMYQILTFDEEKTI